MKDEAAAPEPGHVPTLAEFVPRWMTYQATTNKPNEIARKEYVIKLHILPAFGDMRLDEITTAKIDAWMVDRLNGRKPATVANLAVVLRRLLNVAEQWEVIPAAPRIRQIPVPKVEVDYLTNSEAAAVHSRV